MCSFSSEQFQQKKFVKFNWNQIGNVKAVKILLENGVDPNSRFTNVHVPFDVSALEIAFSFGMFHTASK